MISAVQLHRMMVSMNTLSDCTMPCATGCLTSATAATLGALPRPASLENRPRLTPMMMAAPMPPAKAGSKPKALRKMVPNASGMALALLPMTKIAMAM